MTTTRAAPRDLFEDLQHAGVVALVVAACVHIALDVDIPFVIAIHSFAGWLFLLAWPLGVMAWWRGRPIRACVCALLACAHLWWVLPAGLATPPSTGGHSLKVLSVNVLAANTQRGDLAAEISSADADIVVVQELTSAWAHVLDSLLRDRLPHAHTEIREDAFGIGVFSRFPLTDAETEFVQGAPMLRVDVELPHRKSPLAVHAIHTRPPTRRRFAMARRAQLLHLRQRVAESPHFVVLGDLNLTAHDPLYDQLVRPPVLDAMGSCGRWVGWTWPNGFVPMPPIRLDHALHSSSLACVELREGVGAGSDHRPIHAVFEYNSD